MKIMAPIAIIMFMLSLVACDKGSSTNTTAASTSSSTCTSTASTACNELEAANNGSQVTSGSTTTNAAQVPSTSIIAARSVTPTSTSSKVTNAQVQAKAAQVKAEAQRMSEDPESAIDGPKFEDASLASASNDSASSSLVSGSSQGSSVHQTKSSDGRSDNKRASSPSTPEAQIQETMLELQPRGSSREPATARQASRLSLEEEDLPSQQSRPQPAIAH